MTGNNEKIASVLRGRLIAECSCFLNIPTLERRLSTNEMSETAQQIQTKYFDRLIEAYGLPEEDLSGFKEYLVHQLPQDLLELLTQIEEKGPKSPPRCR